MRVIQVHIRRAKARPPGGQGASPDLASGSRQFADHGAVSPARREARSATAPREGLGPGAALAIFLLALLAILAVTSFAEAAPFTSPGTGANYTMASLEAAAGGQVSALPGPPTCHYRIADTVIISNLDTLTIAAGCKLDFDNSRALTIRGRLIVAGTQALPVRFNS